MSMAGVIRESLGEVDEEGDTQKVYVDRTDIYGTKYDE